MSWWRLPAEVATPDTAIVRVSDIDENGKPRGMDRHFPAFVEAMRGVFRSRAWNVVDDDNNPFLFREFYHPDVFGNTKYFYVPDKPPQVMHYIVRKRG